MIQVRRLNEDGIELFQEWLDTSGQGEMPPSDLLDSNTYSEPAYDVQVDSSQEFSTRYELGCYLVDKFNGIDPRELLSKKNDGLWAWLAILYFSQLAPGRRSRSEHYIVTRNSLKGSLAYRQGPRTSYELVKIHCENACVCLNRPMKTFGDMAEQLASRQNIAYNKGYFEAACKLYVRNGSIRRGAASRAKKPSKRAPGDKTGFGGADRLAKAVRRLDLTYDIISMHSEEMLETLPKEFDKWQE
ncbi:MAG: hypothetical protein C0623_06620 [Desulfuromonas sp.]|nr:MAG: hypothetical protein C0623_06620 [Desulfuromonas sp.]